MTLKNTYATLDSTGNVPLSQLGNVPVITEITDIPTAQNNASYVLSPDGSGGVEWRAESAGGSTNLDGGHATSIYGGTTALNGGYA